MALDNLFEKKLLILFSGLICKKLLSFGNFFFGALDISTILTLFLKKIYQI